MPTPKEIIHDISHSANTPYAKTFEKMIERSDDRGALQPKFQVVNMMPEGPTGRRVVWPVCSAHMAR